MDPRDLSAFLRYPDLIWTSLPKNSERVRLMANAFSTASRLVDQEASMGNVSTMQSVALTNLAVYLKEWGKALAKEYERQKFEEFNVRGNPQ